MSTTVAQQTAPSARQYAYELADVVSSLGASILAAFASLAKSLVTGDDVETSTHHIASCAELVQVASSQIDTVRTLLVQLGAVVPRRCDPGHIHTQLDVADLCGALKKHGLLPDCDMTAEVVAWYKKSGTTGVLTDLDGLALDLDTLISKLLGIVGAMWAAGCGVDEADILYLYKSGQSCLQLFMRVLTMFNQLLSGCMAAGAISAERYLRIQEPGLLPPSLVSIGTDAHAAE
jgi:hypothetical protein